MSGVTGEALRRLRAQANAGMAPDSPSESAQARELLLQWHRDRLIDSGHFDLDGRYQRGDACGTDDFEGIEWLGELAALGHIPAAALLRRGLDERRLGELFAAAPERFAAAARGIERFADWLAQSASREAQPDPAVIEHWLQLGSASSKAMAAILAAFRELAITPGPEDIQQIAWAIQRHWTSVTVNPRLAAELLTVMAEKRLVSGPPAERQAGIALLARAGRLAPGSARGWSALYELARNSPYMREWLAKYPTPSSREPDALVAAALDYETGVADGRPEVRAAILLYSLGLNESPWEADREGEPRMEFCAAIARWLLWRARPDDHRARAAALGWQRRAGQ